jgi:ribonuclease HI
MSDAATSSEPWLLRFDGGSVGNPGPSAGAAILTRTDGAVLRASRFLAHATNNQAEYAGLLCGLELARQAGATRLLVQGDSKLVVCQFTGEWQVKDPALQLCLAQARELAQAFDAVTASWIPRDENAAADAEVRRCLDANAPAAVGARASFQELAKLKVGGSDKFSRMKREALVALLGAEADAALATISVGVADAGPADGREKLELTALRWVARGLSPEQAAQKVLIDLEIGRQASKRRRPRGAR